MTAPLQTDEVAAVGQSLDRHWFWGPFVRNWWSYTQVAVAAVATNFFALASALFVMTVYDRVLPNDAIESLVALALGMAIVVTFDLLIKMLRAYFIDKAGQQVDLQVGRAMFRQILSLRLSGRKSSTGALASTVREFDWLRDFFASATLATVVDLPFILLFLCVIWLIGGPLVLVPALAVPLVFVAGLVVQPFLARATRQGAQSSHGKQSVLVETATGLETIKATGAGDLMMRRWTESLREGGRVGLVGRLLGQVTVNAAGFAQQAAQVGVVVMGVFLVRDGMVTAGALIASVILSGRALAPLGQLAQVLSRANHAVTAYRSLSQLMAVDLETDPSRRYLRRDRLDGGIEFRNVVFSYPERPVRALDDVSFRIEPGERVAILGRNGSGKSTIARLALGLYLADEGAVMIDGTEIRQIHPDDLRRNIGSVLQDVWLFAGTIRENLTLGDERIADEAILAASTVSGLHDTVGQIPAGYDLRLAERGEGLSGGQRQSIAVARAVLKRPAAFVMDEPSSAMDTRSEALFIERLKPVVQGRTLVLVTHRTTMLELVDRVIVIDRGKVVADGPKEQVLGRQALRSGAEVRLQREATA